VTANRLYHASAGSLIALMCLCVAWELWLAALRPGGSWLAVKALALLAPLAGILRRKIYTYPWSSMLILGYFIEGVVRGYAEQAHRYCCHSSPRASCGSRSRR
jgi:uncharacterized membrane protein